MIRISPVEKRWMKSFAYRLSEIMETQEVSQAELARRTGLSQGTISRYLAGEVSPKAYHLLYIAESLGVFIDELLYF